MKNRSHKCPTDRRSGYWLHHHRSMLVVVFLFGSEIEMVAPSPSIYARRRLLACSDLRLRWWRQLLKREGEEMVAPSSSCTIWLDLCMHAPIRPCDSGGGFENQKEGRWWWWIGEENGEEMVGGGVEERRREEKGGED